MNKKFLLIGSGNFVNEIRPALSGLAMKIKIANNHRDICSRLKGGDIDLVILDDDSADFTLPILQRSKTKFVILSSKRSTRAVSCAREAGACDYILKPYNMRELNLRLSAVINNKTRVSCIGGGTGLFNLLMGIKNVPGLIPSSIVSMTDDGGSSGRLRESLGILPPGDVRRSLVALSNAPEVMNDIMMYRFDRGSCFVGHNLGNLLLAALSNIKGSMSDAVSSMGDVLNIQGIVYPVSPTVSKLCALFEDGTIVKGESDIDLCKNRSHELHIKKCWHEPESRCNIAAYSSIINSDFVIIGPGDLFTSVITNLLVKCVGKAIIETKAKKIYVCNLMTKPGETSNFDVLDHVREVLKYLKEDCLDYIVISDNNKFSKDAVSRYSRKKQFPVEVGDLREIKKITKAKIVVADVAHERELIRHNSERLKNVILQIIKKERVIHRYG
ncbi:MAG: uridine diphosphate-N-acetylglucosamine-binding protein YvcK [Candidatus Omnitrophica bacterium]|nr:uridine diphosphate-N-acetylglucosamine-binding protein YvcK [Candidatus Omnitrophota bacterium]